MEELKMDVDLTNPEITLTVDRQRAMIEGVCTQQIGHANTNCFIWKRTFENKGK